MISFIQRARASKTIPVCTTSQRFGHILWVECISLPSHDYWHCRRSTFCRAPAVWLSVTPTVSQNCAVFVKAVSSRRSPVFTTRTQSTRVYPQRLWEAEVWESVTLSVCMRFAKYCFFYFFFSFSVFVCLHSYSFQIITKSTAKQYNKNKKWVNGKQQHNTAPRCFFHTIKCHDSLSCRAEEKGRWKERRASSELSAPRIKCLSDLWVTQTMGAVSAIRW